MTSTLPDLRPASEVRAARDKRRVGLALLSVFVLAGAFGLFGTRTTTASATASGYTVTVTYPQISRPGHAVRYEVEVNRSGGFTGPVQMRFRSAYFDLFDENSFGPAAESETSDAAYDIYEFAAPKGDTLVVSSDTRVEPARQRGERGEVSVLDDSGNPVVTVRYRTRIFP